MENISSSGGKMKYFLFALQIVMLLAALPSVKGECAFPLMGDGSSTIAPPIVDTQSTGFSANTRSSTSEDARLLTIGLQWSTVFNRRLVYVGFGSYSGACALQNPARVKVDNSSNSCLTFVTATYVWPSTLYGVCAPLFTDEKSDETAERLSVSLLVQYEETYNITRAGHIFTFKKVIDSSLPLIFTFPKTIDVATSAVTLFSSASIDVQGGLLEQRISTNSPFQTQFFTLSGRAFILSNPIPSYSGTQIPLAINVNYFSSNILSNTTRQAIWTMWVTPDKGSCQLDGIYSIKFTLSWSGTDSNGNPLPPSRNPLPVNQTVVIQFSLVSQNYCGGVVSQTITPTLNVYRYPVDPNNISILQLKQVPSFFSDDTMYFQGIVTSYNLPLTSTKLDKLWVTFTDKTPTITLVESGESLFPSINFTLSPTQLKDQALFQLKLSSSVFNIPLDSSMEFSFNVILVVSYQNSRKREEWGNRRLRQVNGGAVALATRKVVTIVGPSSSDSSMLTSSRLCQLFGLFLLFWYLLA